MPAPKTERLCLMGEMYSPDEGFAPRVYATILLLTFQLDLLNSLFQTSKNLVELRVVLAFTVPRLAFDGRSA